MDYFSKYPEVARLSSNSEAVIMAIKDMFARHGIPERLIADNMHFNSVKFKDFASKWEFEVVASSPHYLKSNGLIERKVQTVKQLLRKADKSKQDAFLALLEFHNSPISGMDESPNKPNQPNTDAGIETPEMELHPNIPQEEQPARRSLQIRRPPQRLIDNIQEYCQATIS